MRLYLPVQEFSSLLKPVSHWHELFVLLQYENSPHGCMGPPSCSEKQNFYDTNFNTTSLPNSYKRNMSFTAVLNGQIRNRNYPGDMNVHTH